MKRLATIAFLGLFLVACDDINDIKTGETEIGYRSFEEICVDGVVYLYYASGHKMGITAKLQPDGNPVTCS